ncbi:MAG: 3-keto-5-aminohexanoate cleavage protein [Deferrisomatales bacterium]|nr:3-keto-5-aminohexanoate cleavage protein [Deferrisomatales bacterium]
MDRLVVTAAITGGASPASNPYLPKNAKLQIQAAVDAWNAGATVVHIHARNPDTGEAEHRAEYFAEAVAGIRDRTDLIVNVTTGGSGRRVDGEWLYKEVPTESVQGRVSVLPQLCRDPATKPDIASFNAGSPVIDIYSENKKEFLLKFVMVQSFPDMQHMARVMKELGIKPELECYDVGMINNALFLRKIGELEDPLYFQLVMGVLGQIPATLDNLIHMRRCIPEGLPWSVCAVGLDEWPMVTASMIMGGNVRVGFEDNIYLARGKLAKSNAEMVEKAVRIARELDRELANPAEAREQLGLPPRH